MKATATDAMVHAPEPDLLLDLAAMFEGSFSLDWLVELTDMKASAILSILEDQTQKGVLSRVKPAIYLFENKQRQARLANQPPEQREAFHLHIASILVRELSEDELKPLAIAEHLLHVPVDWQGCQWLMQAGEIYAASFQEKKAIACFHHVCDQLSQRRGEMEDLLFIKAAIAQSNNFAGRGNLSLHLSYLSDARERAISRDWQVYALMLEMHIAKYERLSAEFNRGIQRFQAAYAKTLTLNDPELTSAAAVFRTYFLFWQGKFQEAILVFEKTVPDVQKLPLAFFPLLATLMIGHCYIMVGQITQGLGMLDNVRNYCAKTGNRYLLAHASSTLAIAMLALNRIDDTLYYLKLSLKEAKESENVWVMQLATLLMALALHLKGNSSRALTFLRRFTKIKSRVMGNLLYFPYLLEICYYMDSGALRQMPGFSLTNEIESMLKINNIFIKGLAYRYKALQKCAPGQATEKKIRALNLSAKWLQKSGSHIELAKTNLALIRLYLASGNSKKAKTIMTTADDIRMAKEFNLIPDDLQSLIADENRNEKLLAEILNMAVQMTEYDNNNKLLQQIIAAVNRITGAERGALLVVSDQEPAPGLVLRASKNITMDQIADPLFAPSLKMIQKVIQTGHSLLFETDKVDEDSISIREIIRSSICMPIAVGKKVIGVLYHDNRLLGNVFDTLDFKPLAYFAALAAMHLDRENKRELLEQLKEKDGEETIFQPQGNSTALDHPEGMIGNSRAFKQVLSQIGQIAATNTTVLITGETGVGKNLVAGAIHRHSLRSKGAFVTVQCSALTEGLITSELFGHEKGAFTGATNRHIGRFELADGGTLFLDEIGDLSLEVQARLLRVLQSKEFERVGGGKDVLTSDFRLIAATNKNLEAEVEANRFRKDLFFRINVFPLHVPPLRDRREDIPLLATSFIEALESHNGGGQAKLPQKAIKSLMQYDWPGNIRELENVIQRGLVAGNGRVFHVPPLHNDKARPLPRTDIQSLEDNERQHIIAALSKSHGKIHGPGGAAQLLRINPSTLSSRLKKLAINRTAYR